MFDSHSRKRLETNLVVKIGLIVALQQESGSFGIVLLRSDVQRRQTNFRAFRIIFEKNRHHFVVTLLKANRQWGKSILGSEQSIECRKVQRSVSYFGR